jgi:hypothetical protein
VNIKSSEPCALFLRTLLQGDSDALLGNAFTGRTNIAADMATIDEGNAQKK